MTLAGRTTRLAALLALLVWLACGGGEPPTSPPAVTLPSPPPAPIPDGWTLLPGSPASPANSRHDDIVFLDPSRGWLVNVRGEVHRTTDGGTSWERVGTLPGAFPRCVGFASAEKGWIGNINTTAGRITPDSSLFETVDGGRSWTNISLRIQVGEWAWKVQFATDRVGYVTTEGPSAEGVVLKTTDGGQTWQKVAVSAGSSFEGVGFVTAERGWVASGQSLHSTADGGTTSTRLDFGTAINRMRVISPTLVYAAGDRVYRWIGATGGP